MLHFDLVSILFGTSIPTSFNILVKMFYTCLPRNDNNTITATENNKIADNNNITAAYNNKITAAVLFLIILLCNSDTL